MILVIIRKTGDKGLINRSLFFIIAIFPLPMFKITENIESWIADPTNNVIEPGSVIVRKRFIPIPRTYKSHKEWCLFGARGRCLACAVLSCRGYIRGRT